ncbi:hypothetical protein BN2497_8867 [Janthinobacterium sp. CG23_2]|nr:hypothetical protein BN2497_8867 [Janthinobacterium sp. CG23_2]CUU30831.1 hypothetical protein BN3177_8867 [Janthinobacterium sp. CG23_2]
MCSVHPVSLCADLCPLAGVTPDWKRYHRKHTNITPIDFRCQRVNSAPRRHPECERPGWRSLGRRRRTRR